MEICFGDKKYSKINLGDFKEPNYDISTDWLKDKEDKRMVRILNFLGANVTVENYREKIQDGSLEDILQRIENIKKDIADADEKFMLFQEQHNEEYEEIEKSEQIEEQIIQKAGIDYLNEIKVLLPKEEQEKIGNLLQGNREYKSEYFNNSVKSEILIESFTQEAEEILANGDEYDQDNIKRKRIEYFKSKGIDLGNNYEDYLNSQEAQKIKPDIRIC